jgi:hypothetical protein
MGHVRDLPASAAEIPEKYKGVAWSRLGVNVEDDFDPLYVIPDKKRKLIAELKAALKEADELILATDEDREGESIGWHLHEVLKPKQPVRRMVFHEITREAIEQALRRRAPSTSIWCAPRRRGASSTGWSATRCRRCSGARLRPSSPPGACRAWPCACWCCASGSAAPLLPGSTGTCALLNKRPDQPNHRFEATLVSGGRQARRQRARLRRAHRAHCRGQGCAAAQPAGGGDAAARLITAAWVCRRAWRRRTPRVRPTRPSPPAPCNRKPTASWV